MSIRRKTFEGWFAERLGADPDAVEAINRLSLGQSALLCRSAIVQLFKRDGVSSYVERMSDEAILIYYKGMEREKLERLILAEIELQSTSNRAMILRQLGREMGIEKKGRSSLSDHPEDNTPDPDRVPDDYFLERPTSSKPPKSNPSGKRPEDDPIIKAAIERASLRPPGQEYAETLRRMKNQKSDPPVHSTIRPTKANQSTTIIPPATELAKRRKRRQ